MQSPEPALSSDARRAAATLDVAVVIVTYKSASLTLDCLRSVQQERATPELRIRAIVVDNASGDASVIEQAVTAHGWSDWVTVVRAPLNGGFAYGNNLGLYHACTERSPDYVYLLNPDTQVRAGAIGALARFLEAHPDVGIAGSSLENPDGSDWPFAFRFPSVISELIYGVNLGVITKILEPWHVPKRMGKHSEAVDWVSGASLMVRAEVFTAIGGLDEHYFLYFEETDFCRRARKAGFTTWYVPNSRVMHIGGQSTGSVSSAQMRRLPGYWFESRRRYFVASFGVPLAMAIDAVSICAQSLGLAKRHLQGRQHTTTPYFIRDLICHSVLWPRNRSNAAAKNSNPCIQTATQRTKVPAT